MKNKRRLQKSLSLIIAFVCTIASLCASFQNTLVYGANNTSYDYIFEENEFLYGSQLSEDSQFVYLELLKKLNVPSEKQFQISLDGRAVSKVSAIMNDAIAALLYDFPDYQWLQLGGSNSTYYQTSHIDEVVKNVIFYPVKDKYYKRLTAITQEQAKVNDLLDTLIKEMPSTYKTRYSRLKYIHDYLVKTITYDTTQNGEQIRSAAGALINQLSVCEGYAKAFKLACEKIGVPCLVVFSDVHMWNYVQMENGYWYLVDVTFDDPTINGTSDYPDGMNLSHDYFLKGTKTMASSKNHISSENSLSDGIHQMLAKNDYSKAKAKDEKLVVYSEKFSERFIENLTKPTFAASKKTIYQDQTLSQDIKRLSDYAVVSYKSSDKSVATISRKGLINAVGTGSCVITTLVKQGGKLYTHTMSLTVKKPLLTFENSVASIRMGELFQFSVDKTGISKDVVWSVNDKTVAIIYKGGTLKPLKPGEVVVTASAGKERIQMKVKVSK